MQFTKHILSLLILFISCFSTNAAVRISTQIPKTYYNRFPIYFNHSDHLGSATFITDYYGEPKQFLHYMPYGELFANQQTSSYNERFKFTGKERDTETDYDYFGARYYSSDYINWISPDPLLDKYPSISPYAYCSNNPIKYVDPDGNKIYFAPNVSIDFKKDFRIAVQYMNRHNISQILYKLEQSPNIYYINEGEQGKGSEFKITTKTITWSSRTGIITDNLYEMLPIEVLNHELDHALEYDTNPTQQMQNGKTKDINYDNKEEKRVITGSEQSTAKKLGRLKEGEVTRNNHNGSTYETISPISTEDKFYIKPHNE